MVKYLWKDYGSKKEWRMKNSFIIPFMIIQSPITSVKRITWWLSDELLFYNCTNNWTLLSNTFSTEASLWLSGEESACQCGVHRFNPWSVRIQCTAELLSQSIIVIEPVLQSPRTATTERTCCYCWSLCPQSLCSAHHSERPTAAGQWLPCSETGERPVRGRRASIVKNTNK